MKKISDEELLKVFHIWCSKYELRDAEGKLTPFLEDSLSPYRQQKPWITNLFQR